MSLSIESIYQPLNDFFVSKYPAATDSPVAFRLDKFGSVIVDGDFKDPHHPELGYSPVVAREKFSMIVNHLPIEDPDGVSVVLSQDTIDDAYFYRLLSPSTPYVPPAADDQTKASIASAFGAVKAAALALWQNVNYESSTVFGTQYRPCIATPETWYDGSDASWTGHSFHVSGAAPDPAAAPDDARFQLWTQQLDDVTAQQALQADHVSIPPSAGRGGMSDKDALVAGAIGEGVGLLGKMLGGMVGDAAYQRYVDNSQLVDIGTRLLVKKALAKKAPKHRAGTDDITIAFEYCIVQINRPWYLPAFVNDGSWWIPGIPKGGSSQNGAGRLTLLPIAFIALRKLTIEAKWSSDDVANAKNATDFGPFKVDPAIVDNRLSHVGIQIIGWLLQRLPPLPPNGAPTG